MVGTWLVHQLQQEHVGIGPDRRFSYVEFGPGKGTMASDILRVFNTSDRLGRFSNCCIRDRFRTIDLMFVSPEWSLPQNSILLHVFIHGWLHRPGDSSRVL